MKIRRIVPLAAIGVLAAGAFLPAAAAPAKPFTGSYNLTLQPDPTINAFSSAGEKNCFNLKPDAVDRRSLNVPRAGKFTINLVSPDPTSRNLTDWDMYITDKGGAMLAEANGATSTEQAVITFKKATAINVAVCNLAGTEKGTVTYKLK